MVNRVNRWCVFIFIYSIKTMFKRMRLAKEIQKIIKSVDRFSDGQAYISHFNHDDVGQIQVVIQPNDGLYEGGQWEFKVRLTFM